MGRVVSEVEVLVGVSIVWTSHVCVYYEEASFGLRERGTDRSGDVAGNGSASSLPESVSEVSSSAIVEISVEGAELIGSDGGGRGGRVGTPSVLSFVGEGGGFALADGCIEFAGRAGSFGVKSSGGGGGGGSSDMIKLATFVVFEP